MTIDTNTIREDLETELQLRLSQIENIENRLRQPGEQDWEEQATQRENDEVLESLDKQTVLEIEQIKQALKRIEDGKYGICTYCGKAIAGDRLQALPYAPDCIQCASRT